MNEKLLNQGSANKINDLNSRCEIRALFLYWDIENECAHGLKPPLFNQLLPHSWRQGRRPGNGTLKFSITRIVRSGSVETETYGTIFVLGEMSPSSKYLKETEQNKNIKLHIRIMNMFSKFIFFILCILI